MRSRGYDLRVVGWIVGAAYAAFTSITYYVDAVDDRSWFMLFLAFVFGWVWMTLWESAQQRRSQNLDDLCERDTQQMIDKLWGGRNPLTPDLSDEAE